MINKENEFLSAEYETLREEVLSVIHSQINSLNLALGGTIIIVGFCLSKNFNTPIIYLSPIVLLSTCLIKLVQDYYTIIHISIFIQVAHEQENKRWENWMAFLRRKHSNKFFNLTSIYATAIFWCLIFGSGLICFGFFIHFYGLHKLWQDATKIDIAKNIDWQCIIFLLLIAWWIFLSYKSFVAVIPSTSSKYETTNKKLFKCWSDSKNKEEEDACLKNVEEETRKEKRFMAKTVATKSIAIKTDTSQHEQQ